VVEKVVTVAQREHELRGLAIACSADDDTINGPVPLHLYPLTTARRAVLAISALDDDPFDRRQQPQPRSSRLYVRSLQDQLVSWLHRPSMTYGASRSLVLMTWVWKGERKSAAKAGANLPAVHLP
jgi:hypothetical protein